MLILHRAKRKARVMTLVLRNELWRKAMILLWREVCRDGELCLEGGAFLAIAPKLHVGRVAGDSEVVFTTTR